MTASAITIPATVNGRALSRHADSEREREPEGHVGPAAEAQPDEDDRDEHEQCDEDHAPAGEERRQIVGVEPPGPQVDEDRTGTDAEQRERDRQEPEVVVELGGEQPRDEHLERQRCAGDEGDRERYAGQGAVGQGR